VRKDLSRNIKDKATDDCQGVLDNRSVEVAHRVQADLYEPLLDIFSVKTEMQVSLRHSHRRGHR